MTSEVAEADQNDRYNLFATVHRIRRLHRSVRNCGQAGRAHTGCGSSFLKYTASGTVRSQYIMQFLDWRKPKRIWITLFLGAG
jgi:hypothetical protein